MDPEKKKKLLDTTKKLVRSVLMGFKDGCPDIRFLSQYEENCCESCPYRKLGYGNLEAMFRDMPDVVRVVGNTYFGVADQSTAHIQRMVKAQRSNKKSTSRGKFNKAVRSGGRPSYRGRSTARGGASFRTGPTSGYNRCTSYNSGQKRGGATGGLGSGPARGGATGGLGSGPGLFGQARHGPPQTKFSQGSQQASRAVLPSQHKRSSPPREQPRRATGGWPTVRAEQPPRAKSSWAPAEADWQNGQQEKETRVGATFGGADKKNQKPAVLKFGEKYDIPPRFKNMQQGDGRMIATKSPEREHYDLRQALNNKRAAPASYYRSALTLWFNNQGNSGALNFKTIALNKPGEYISSIEINDRNFASGPGEFKGRREAEGEAAKVACEKLGILRDLDNQGKPGQANKPHRPVSGDPSSSSWPKHVGNVEKCKAEVKEWLRSTLPEYHAGLWASSLPIVYRQKLEQEPPEELIEWVKQMPDVVRVQHVELTNKDILYAVPSVTITQSGPSSRLRKIPPAVMPPKGDVPVAVTYCKDPWNIYVQLHHSTQAINAIKSLLKENYACRGAPNPLVNPQVGEHCVAQYQYDDEWYRGEIRKYNKDKQVCSVFYVDYGNTEDVHAGKVRRLLDLVKLCNTAGLAIHCSLYNVFPRKGFWTKEITAAMNRLLNTPLRMRVHEVKDEDCSVEFFFENDEVMSFNEQLVTRELAVTYALPPEPETLTLPDSSEWHVRMVFIASTTDLKILIDDTAKEHPQYLGRLKEMKEIWLKKATTPLPRDCVKGSICVHKIRELGASEADRADRARIISINANKDTVEIYFVDFGDKEEVKRYDLFQMPVDLNDLPYQAIPCKLVGLEQYAKDPRIIEELGKHLDEALIAEVRDRLEPVSIVLYSVSGDEDVDINAKVAEVANDKEPQLPPVGSRVEGYVASIQPDGHLYLLLCGPGLDRLQRVLSEMNEAYSSTDPNLIVSEPEEEMMVAARYDEEDGNVGWYRAKVLKLLAERKVEVMYVDYGDVTEVPYSNLRKTAKSMEDLPYQGVKVKLANFPPEGVEMTDEALDRLAELVQPVDDSVMVHIEVVDQGMKEGTEEQVPVVELYLEMEMENDAHSGSVEDEDIGEEKNVVTVITAEGVFTSPDWVVVDEADITANTSEFPLPEDSELPEETASEDEELPTEDEKLPKPEDPPLPEDSQLPPSPEGEREGSVSPEWETLVNPEAFYHVSHLYARMDKLSLSPKHGNPVHAAGSSMPVEDSLCSGGGEKEDRAEDGEGEDRGKDGEEEDRAGDGEEDDRAEDGEEDDRAEDEEEDDANTFLENLHQSQQACMELPPLPEFANGDKVYITWTEHPHNFRCYDYSNGERINHLMLSLQSFGKNYLHNREMFKVGSKVRPHAFYIGVYEGDFYRCQVRAVLSDQVSVCFVDYGDCTIIALDDLYHLPPQYRELPAQAMRGKLAGVVPAADEWSSEACDLFNHLVHEQVLTAWTLLGTADDNGFIPMTLIDPGKATNAFIHQALITAGYAKKTPLQSVQ